MTKEISLTISERVAATKLFDDFKGNISVLAMILEDVKGFVVTNEEWKMAELKKTPTDEEVKTMPPNTAQRWEWKDEGSDKSIQVSADSLTYLKDKIKSKSEAGELTLADKSIISLSKKIE